MNEPSTCSTPRSKPFLIEAGTRTLAGRDNALWPEATCSRLQVPIYQRPYSWGKEQIERLVTDLMAAFHAPEQPDSDSSFFIGTMLLSETTDDTQDIIDGQQRLSTLLVVLKVISERYGKLAHSAFARLASRFETKVTSEQRHFSVFCDGSSDADLQNNAYIRAKSVIDLLFDQIGLEACLPSSIEAERPLDVASFVDFLLRRVYFVVIEASGSLVRKLQIFDSINTAGMDLGSGDIFKIRYYDYLRHVRAADDSVFPRIDGLYKMLSESRGSDGHPVSSMDEILRLYQAITVSRLGLARSRFNDHPLSFFETAFDAAMKKTRIEGWSEDDVSKVQLADERTFSLHEFEDIIRTRIEWDADQPFANVESRCALHLIQGSRYPRYWVSPVLFRHRFPGNKLAVEAFTVQLAKLLVTYSFLAARSIYKVHGLMHDLYAELFAAGREQTHESIIDRLHRETINAEVYSTLDKNLRDNPLTDNTTRKYLGCRISAMLHEFEGPDTHSDELVDLIFNTEVDVEHIQPIHDKDGNKREDIWSEWGADMNHIGNLVLLERGVNRSISNRDYVGIKRNAYASSGFRIVRELAQQHESWDLRRCQARAELQRARLVSYLRGKSLVSHSRTQLNTP